MKLEIRVSGVTDSTSVTRSSRRLDDDLFGLLGFNLQERAMLIHNGLMLRVSGAKMTSETVFASMPARFLTTRPVEQSSSPGGKNIRGARLKVGVHGVYTRYRINQCGSCCMAIVQ
jgi:hypothetical protein